MLTAPARTLRYNLTAIIPAATTPQEALGSAVSAVEEHRGAWMDDSLSWHSASPGGRWERFYAIKRESGLSQTLIDPLNVFLGEPEWHTFLAQKRDIDFAAMLASPTLTERDKNSLEDAQMIALASWALLHDGHWRDRRSHPNLSSWFGEFRKALRALDDDSWLVMMDCEFSSKDKL